MRRAAGERTRTALTMDVRDPHAVPRDRSAARHHHAVVAKGERFRAHPRMRPCVTGRRPPAGLVDLPQELLVSA